LLVAAAGFLAHFVTAQARARGPVSAWPVARRFTRPLPRALDTARAQLYRAADKIVGVDWLGRLAGGGRRRLCCRPWPCLQASRHGAAGSAAPPVSRDKQSLSCALIALAFRCWFWNGGSRRCTPRQRREGKSLTYYLRLLDLHLDGLGSWLWPLRGSR